MGESIDFDSYPAYVGSHVQGLLQSMARDLHKAGDRITELVERGPRTSLKDLLPEWMPQVAEAFAAIRSLMGNMTEYESAMKMAADHDRAVRVEQLEGLLAELVTREEDGSLRLRFNDVNLRALSFGDDLDRALPS